MKSANDQSSIKFIYKNILDFANLTMAILILPLLFASLSRFFLGGFHWIFLFHIILSLFLWVIYLLRKQINMDIRVLSIILITIVLVFPSIPMMGFKSPWGVVIFMASVFASIFYGKKAGFFIIAFGFLYYSVFGYLYLIAPNTNGFSSVLSYKDTPAFISQLVSTTFFPLMIVLAIDKFRNHFINSINNLVESNKKIVEIEKKSRFLSEITFEGIVILQEGFIIDMNTSFLRLVGYEKDEITDRNIVDLLVHEDYKNMVRDKIKEAYALPYEIKLVKKDSSVFSVEIEARNIKTEFGKVIRVVAVRDITERIKNRKQLSLSRKELEDSEKLYRGIVRNMIGGFYKVDKNRNFTMVSPSTVHITGFSEDEIIGKSIPSFFEDTSQIEEVLRKLINEGKLERFRTKLKTKNRGYIFIEINTRVIYNSKGEFDGSEGVFYDITNQVKNEELIQKLSTAVTQSPNTIVITDINGNIEYVNPAFTKVTGYEAHEVLGKNSRILSSGVHPADYFVELWKTISKGDTWRGEFCNKTKQGELFWENVSITSIKDSRGKIINYLAIKEDITEKKKNEENILRFDVAAKQITEGIVYTDKDANFLFVNKAFCNMTGYTQDELLSMNVYDMVPDESPRPDSYISYAKEINGSVIGILKRKNGSYFQAEIIPSILNFNNDNFVLTIVKDITDRIKAKEVLLQQKEQLELSNVRMESLLQISERNFDSIQDMLEFALNEAIKLTRSRIGFIMHYYEDTHELVLNSWSEEVMKLCKIKEEVTAFDANKAGLLGEPIRLKKPVIINNYKADISRKKGITDGHIEIDNFLGVPVISEKKVVAVIAVANKSGDYDETDIMQITLLMDSVWKISDKIQLIEELKIAKEQAEQSDRLKSAFLASMSHEIRTPLNAIVGFSNIIAEDSKNDKYLEFSTIINKQSTLLLQLINDMLDYSKIEAGSLKIQNEPFELNDIVNETYEVYKTSCPATIELIPKTPKYQIIVYSDELRLKQILFNLVSNAIKFTKEGSVIFGFDVDEGSEVIGFVKDTGIGIPVDKQDLIFERFSKLDDFSQGTGLGLSIVRSLIKLMGGEIWLKSEPGKGSEFYFKIPCKKLFLDKEKKKSLQLPNKEELLNKTVLIAEDDESNYSYLVELIQSKGIKTVHAINGKQAVEICKTNPEISLVLMDVKMPKLDGYEATKLIKGLFPDLPVIIQTAYASNSDREKALAAGCDDYLSKPTSKEVLFRILEKNIIKG